MDHLIGVSLLALIVAIVAYGLINGVREVHAQQRLAEQLNKGQVQENLQILLTRGHEDGWMMFEDRDTGKFVQFRKHNDRLQAIFPRAPWSEPYYFRIEALLGDLGIASSREALREDTAPPEYIRAEFGADTSSAAEFIVKVFRSIFYTDTESVKITSDRIRPFSNASLPRPSGVMGIAKRWREHSKN